MIVFIPRNLMNPEAVTLYEQGNLSTNVVIDYASNNLIGYTDKAEIEIFSFNKYFNLHNRSSSYKTDFVVYGKVFVGINISFN